MGRDLKGKFTKDSDDEENANFKVLREIERPITLKAIVLAFIVGWLAVILFPKLADKGESLIVDHYCNSPIVNKQPSAPEKESSKMKPGF